MRAAALALLLLAAVSPARAERLKTFKKQFRGTGTPDAATDVESAYRRHDHDGALAQLTALVFALPYAYSMGLGDEGWAPHPYADGAKGDFGDCGIAQRLEVFYHRVGDGIGAWGGLWRLDSVKHVGLEAFWSHYRERGDEDMHYVYGTTHGDLAREENWRADYQLGLAALAGRTTRVGPRLAVEGEGYPGKPFFVDALAGVAFIDNGPLGELRAGAGVVIKRVQIRFGWRALIGPFKTLDGPDAGLTFRF